MLDNDLGVSDEEALRLVRERLTKARAELAQAESSLRQHKADRKAGRRIEVALTRRMIKQLKEDIPKLKSAIALAETAERELVARTAGNVLEA